MGEDRSYRWEHLIRELEGQGVRVQIDKDVHVDPNLVILENPMGEGLRQRAFFASLVANVTFLDEEYDAVRIKANPPEEAGKLRFVEINQGETERFRYYVAIHSPKDGMDIGHVEHPIYQGHAIKLRGEIFIVKRVREDEVGNMDVEVERYKGDQ